MPNSKDVSEDRRGPGTGRRPAAPPPPATGSLAAKRKLRLEAMKLALEQRLITRQLSWEGRAWEWLKSIGVIGTLLAATAAFFVGFQQLEQNAEKQTVERFDRALSRLAASRTEEKITGVAGVQLFLAPEFKLYHDQALVVLVNALVVDEDERTRGAILDVLESITPDALSEATINSALETAVRSNRRLWAQLTPVLRNQRLEAQRAILTKYQIELPPTGLTQTEVPAATISKLSADQYLEYLASPNLDFAKIDIQQLGKLRDASAAINVLTSLSGKVGDYSAIFCAACDFSNVNFSPGVKFDDAVLIFPDFSHAVMVGAFFDGTVLLEANFFDTTLRDANISAKRALDYWAVDDPLAAIPRFECADLRGASIEGLPLMGYSRDTKQRGSQSAFVARMMMTKMDGTTHMPELGIVIRTTISDQYYRDVLANPNFPLDLWPKSKELNIADRLVRQRVIAEYVRDEDDQEITFTAYSSLSRPRLGDEAADLLGAAEQPTWANVPALAEARDAINTAGLMGREPEVLEQKRIWAAQRWTRERPMDCKLNPDADSLIEEVNLPDLLIVIDDEPDEAEPPAEISEGGP